NRVLKNTNAKSSSACVQKTPSSVRIDSNKRETKNSNECQSNASVLNTKNVIAVNDSSNIVYVSYGKDVFMLSHKKCVARYALSRDSRNRSLVHTWYNKTPYELIIGRKPNVYYFYVFGSLCYLTNDHDDLGKMKPKADIGIFIGYFESSTGFRIYNRRTKKIMEMIHVKFDELTSMASECNNSRPGLNCSNFKDSSEELNEIPSQQDLDNFFGPLYEEYYTPSASEVSNNSAANTLDDEDTSSPFSIIIEESDASQIVTSLE
nr:retrovirus-related Pol polyprotein from transposon TNT 1-94 [Tanacetum cinerariifolium]